MHAFLILCAHVVLCVSVDKVRIFSRNGTKLWTKQPPCESSSPSSSFAARRQKCGKGRRKILVSSVATECIAEPQEIHDSSEVHRRLRICSFTCPLIIHVSVPAVICFLAVSERIMKFAQCPADVGELEIVRQRRDQRAKLRAEGLRLTRTLVAAAASPPAKVTSTVAELSFCPNPTGVYLSLHTLELGCFRLVSC